MRKTFAEELHKHMGKNEDIFLLTGDLGYKMWDTIREDFPKRFLNVGASEQSLMDIAVGLAQAGKIPFVYSITTFLIYRPFETIRTYINQENINVKLVGSGRDKDYLHDGFSHDATDVRQYMDLLTNVVQYWPEHKESIPEAIEDMIKSGKPSFISLQRTV